MFVGSHSRRRQVPSPERKLMLAVSVNSLCQHAFCSLIEAMTSLSDSQNIDLTPGQDDQSTTLPPGSPIQACPHCEALFDITEREPLEMIECPGCAASIQVHGNVDHFQIVE